ncbi:MAG TPA: cupin domain-containing protein [Mycobacteriales bacterium]|jgi:quercetin dioxygenase-like cupin family protein|nr:cupin domain-containing protein [Mycobacteriales bacterium]
MQKMSLEAIAREQLAEARRGSGRAATTVFGGHEQVLRQTVIGLVADADMQEHESPGPATLHVLSGRVRLTAGADSWDGRTGDLIVIPPVRHSVSALEDSVVLLTVAKV